MSMEIAKLYAEGKFKVISQPTDTFKFGCSQCGGCCTGPMDIMLTPYDIFRIAEGLNVNSTEVCNKYIGFHVGPESGLPIGMLEFKKMGKGLGFTMCPFLTPTSTRGKMACGIHGFKPFNCAIYPLGRVTATDKTTGISKMEYIVQEPDCECSKTEEHTLEEWLNNFNLQDSDKVSAAWMMFIDEIHDFLMEIRKLRPEMKLMYQNAITNVLYAGYDSSKGVKPFDEMLERLKKVKTMAKLYMSLAASMGNPEFDEESNAYKTNGTANVEEAYKVLEEAKKEGLSQ